MLVNKDLIFSKGDVITLKNILGEEIICTFVDEGSTHYTVTDAHALGMTQQGMTLAPPVFSGEISGDLKIQKIHIMWAVPTQEKFLAAYKEEISSIQVVETSKKIII